MEIQSLHTRRVSCTAEFKKSSYCGGATCVEAAADGDVIMIRDSKDSHDGEDGPVLRFTVDEWNDFLRGVAAGEFTPAALAVHA